MFLLFKKKLKEREKKEEIYVKSFQLCTTFLRECQNAKHRQEATIDPTLPLPLGLACYQISSAQTS